MSIGAIGSSSSGLSATYWQQLQQQLFAKIDTNGDGQITKTELETALASQGVSTSQADNLFDALSGSSNGSGTITEAEFSTGLQQLLDGQTQSQTIQAQSDQTDLDSTNSGINSTSSLSNLFDQLTGGTGILTQSELEQAFASQGGTTQEADALFSQLDPQGTGTVSQSQFVSGMQQLAAQEAQTQSAQGTQGQNSPGSSSSLSALFDQLTGGTGELTQTELEQAFTNQGGTTQEADALFSQLDPQGTGSVSEAQFVSGMQQIFAQAAQTQSASSSASSNLSSLFDQLTGGSGNLTQSELERAFVSQGGTTQEADALFSQLDPSGASSINESQFVSGMQQILAQGDQAQSTSSSASSNLSNLFDQLTNGSGDLTETELEQAFVSQGGTTQEADVLFSQLDPSGASSISESQFVSGMQQIFAQTAQAQNASSSASSDLSSLFDQLTNGSGQLTQSELEQAFVSEGGTTQEADALFSQLDPSGASSISESQFIAGMQNILAEGAQTQDASSSGVSTSQSQETGSGQSASNSAKSASADSSSSTTTTIINPDGSTTTIVTYADGETVTTTTPPPGGKSSTAGYGNGVSAMLLASAGNLSGLVDQKTVGALLGLLDPVPQAA
jgi:Ca2+-binding EF-hand superfamily protein